MRELRKKLLHHKDGHHDAMDEVALGSRPPERGRGLTEKARGPVQVHEESSLDKDLVMYNMYRKDRKMQRAIVEHRLRSAPPAHASRSWARPLIRLPRDQRRRVSTAFPRSRWNAKWTRPCASAPPPR